MVQALLRLYSYGLQLLICLILLALGLVATLSDNTGFEIDLLPWSGKDLRTAVLLLGGFGLLSLVLAVKGKLRFLFLLWTIGTVYLLGRGIFASSHQFDGESEFKWTLLLLLGLLATVWGAWSRLKQPLRR
jgi:hypothetical protein